MARAELAIATLQSLYPTESTQAAFVSVSAVDGAMYRSTGREIIAVRNTSEDTEYDLTALSVANVYGRGGSNANPQVFTIPFGETHLLMLAKDGYQNRTTKMVSLNAENAALEVAVIRLPNGVR